MNYAANLVKLEKGKADEAVTLAFGETEEGQRNVIVSQ